MSPGASLSPVPDAIVLPLNQPGQVVEVRPEIAAQLGAFEETALSESDALEAADQPATAE